MYALLASAAVFSNNPTAWIGDNRFEQFHNPGRYLTRMFSVWDPSRGLGQVREEFWPLAAGPIALFRAYGASAATAVHLWHVLVLTIAGIGLWSLARALAAPGRFTAGIAGLIYMFGAYSAAFLIPTNLFMNYALAPWIWLLVIQGLRGSSIWRTGAGFALIIFAAGNTEPAGLIYALLYLVPIVAYLLWVDRSTTYARTVRWFALAASLTLLTSAAALYKTGLGTEVFQQNLRETESPKILNVASSWSESWRGLGGWLIYHGDVRGPATPQTLPLITQPVTIVATFVLPGLALAGLALSRWRHRLLFGLMLFVSLVLMVGLHPIDDPSAYGRALESLYDGVPQASVIRNSYKAGMGLVASVAVLAALAVNWTIDWAAAAANKPPLDERRVPRILGVAGALLLVLIAISQPFWNGTLYNPDWELDDVPGYVEEATSWVNDQGPDGRLLAVPDGFRHGFRWGWVNDDVLDAGLARPHAIDVAIHTSRPIPADVLHHVTTSLGDGTYQSGQLAPIAQRLGIDLVMLRNDVDWQTWGQPRPSAYDEFREDEDFQLVASFGEPGSYTTASTDDSLAASRERELPPIEIYQLVERDGFGMARMVNVTPLLVSGSGAAWPTLAQYGWLDDDQPIAYTGELHTSELKRSLGRGAELVVTDTNRRKLELLTLEPVESWTLARDEDLLRDTYELFDHPAAESVADFGDAARVAVAPETFSSNPDASVRPGAAFDGDEITSWQFGDVAAVGQELRVDFAGPATIEGIDISVPGRSRRRIERARISLSDGTNIDAVFSGTGYSIDLTPREITWAEMTVTAVAGSGSSRLAISEIEFRGARVHEVIALPRDVSRRAETDVDLAAALEAAPVSYTFARLVGEGALPEERVIRRRFESWGARELDLAGSLTLGPATPDEVVAALSVSPLKATGSSRLLDRLEFSGMRSVDGDPTTSWIGLGQPDEALRLEFPDTFLRTLTVRYDAGDAFARPSAILAEVGDEQVSVAVSSPTCVADALCLAEVTFDVPVGRARGATLTFTDLEAMDDADPARRPLRVVEVEINRRPNNAPDPGLECSEGLVAIDEVPIPIQIDATLDQVLEAAAPMAFEGCEPVQLASGSHLFEATNGAVIDTAVLRADTNEVAPQPPATGDVTVAARSQTEFDVELSGDTSGRLVLSQSSHPGWHARADGTDLGEARPADTLASWRLPPDAKNVEIEFAPQRGFEVALAVTLAGVLVCLGLLLVTSLRSAQPTES